MKKVDLMSKNSPVMITFYTFVLISIMSSYNVDAYQPIVTIGKPVLIDIQFAPNGLYLATLTSSFIEFLNAETFEPISRIYIPFIPIHNERIIFSPDGSLVAVYGHRGIYIYNAVSKELIMDNQNEVGSAEFAPGGKYLAYSEGDSIIFWDIVQKKQVKKLYGDPEPLLYDGPVDIPSIAFHPSGNVLAVNSWRKTITLWNTETCKIESYLYKGDKPSPNMIKFSNDGSLLAVLYDNQVRLYNILDGSRYYTPSTHANCMDFTNDDNYLIIGEDKGILGIYSVKTGKYETRLAVKQPISSNFGFCTISKITVSPDGQKFACLLNGSRITIWNVKDFSKVRTLYGWNVYSNAVYLPKVNRIITICHPNDLCFWDATTGKLLKTVEFDYYVYSMAASPDGKNVAVNAGGFDRIYDGSTGREIFRFTNERGLSGVMAYSPSGRYLASNGWMGTYIYDAKKGKMIRHISNEWVNTNILLFTHDEKKIVMLSKERDTIEFWDIETGELSYEKQYKGALIRYGDDFIRARSKGRRIEVATINSHEVISYIDAWMPDEHFWGDMFHPNGNIILILTSRLGNRSKCDFYSTWTGKKIGSMSNIDYVSFAGNEHIFVLDENGLELYRISDILGVAPKDLRFKTRPIQFGHVKSELMTNYPNPFNLGTWIPYYLSEDCYIAIKIYSVTGQLVRTLNIGHREAGLYSDKSKAAFWDGNDNDGNSVSSGIYFYTIITNDFMATRKMILLR